MSQHYGWFEAFKNEDGTVSAAIPKEWPQDVKDNFEKSVDVWIARGSEIERERIIELLEQNSRECEKAGLWANGSELRGQLQELHVGLNAAIALIKGENNA